MAREPSAGDRARDRGPAPGDSNRTLFQHSGELLPLVRPTLSPDLRDDRRARSEWRRDRDGASGGHDEATNYRRHGYGDRGCAAGAGRRGRRSPSATGTCAMHPAATSRETGRPMRYAGFRTKRSISPSGRRMWNGCDQTTMKALKRRGSSASRTRRSSWPTRRLSHGDDRSRCADETAHGRRHESAGGSQFAAQGANSRHRGCDPSGTDFIDARSPLVHGRVGCYVASSLRWQVERSQRSRAERLATRQTS